MLLTKNFKREEFDCHDGTIVPEQYHANLKKLVENLQVLRDYIGKPIIVNSGYRTISYNKKIGGASKSQHLTATAADIRVPGMTADKLYRVIDNLIKQGKMHNGGLGWYRSFCHYDVRPNAARWDYR